MKHPERGAILNFRKRSDSTLFHTLRLAEKLHSSAKKCTAKARVPETGEMRRSSKRKSRRAAKTINIVASGMTGGEEQHSSQTPERTVEN